MKKYPKRRVISGYRGSRSLYATLTLSCGHTRTAERMFKIPHRTTCFKCPPVGD